MITKEQLLDSMRHETAVIKHLATKVPEGAYDYRPSAAQRSLGELMEYMTVMAIVPTVYAVDRDWERAEAVEKAMPAFTPESFPDRMDRQMEMIEEELRPVDEAEATTRSSAMPWGTPTPLSAALMDMPLKCYVAYRMQLFLYVKACGVSDIGPANCWAGVDMPKRD
jgi:hypothetical protein